MPKGKEKKYQEKRNQNANHSHQMVLGIPVLTQSMRVYNYMYTIPCTQFPICPIYRQDIKCIFYLNLLHTVENLQNKKNICKSRHIINSK